MPNWDLTYATTSEARCTSPRPKRNRKDVTALANSQPFCRETTRVKAEIEGNRVPIDCRSEACEVEERLSLCILQFLHD